MIRLILGLSLALTFGIGALIQPTAAQVIDYGATVYVVNCSEPIPPDVSPFDDPSLPCEAAVGVTFTVENSETAEPYGTCVTEIVNPENDFGTCTVLADVGVPLWIAEDPPTIPAGYAALQNPIIITLPEGGPPPIAYFINVAQDQQAGMYDLPIRAINCPAQPGPNEFAFDDWQHPCEPAVGIRFIAQEGMDEIGSCVTDVFDAPEPQAAAHCSISIAFGSTVTVVEDVSTVPAEYQAVDPPVVVVTAPSGPDSTEQPVAQFFNVLRTQPPPSDVGAPLPQLPNTGTGASTLRSLLKPFD